MNSRVAKRPPEPYARSDSPPTKRSRPPDPRTPLQDNVRLLHDSLITPAADTGEQTLERTPASWKSTIASPLNAPASFKLASDCNKSINSVQDKTSKPGQVSTNDIRFMSPTSIDSGASTPTHHSAPPAPSMLPLDSRQHESKTASSNPRISLQSLRQLRDRRRAIANEIQANSSDKPIAASISLQAKLIAQQLDISQLKKERDELGDRLKKMEDRFERLDRGSHRPEQDLSESLKPIIARLDAFEKSSLASQENEGLKHAEDRLAAPESALVNIKKDMEQAGQSQDKIRTEILAKMTPLENEISALNEWKLSQPKPITEEIMRKCVAEEVEKTGEALNQWKLSQLKAITEDFMKQFVTEELAKTKDTLNKWMLSQPKAVTEEVIKQFITEEMEKTGDVTAILRKEIAEAEERLTQDIRDEQQSLHDVHDRLDKVESVTATVKNVSEQISKIDNKIDAIQSENKMAQPITLKVEKNLEDLQNHTNALESKFNNKLQSIENYMLGFKSLQVNKRLQKVEKTSEELRLLKLDVRLEEAEKASKASKGLVSKVDNRLKSVEKASQDLALQIDERLEDVEKASRDLASQLDSRLEDVEKASQDLTLQIESRLESAEEVSQRFLESNVDERLKDIENVSRDLASNVDKLFKRVEEVSRDFLALQVNSRLEDVERASKSFLAMKDQIVLHMPLEASFTRFEQRLSEQNHTKQKELDSKFAKIEALASKPLPVIGENPPTVANIKTLEGLIKGIQTDLGALSDDLQETDQKIHEHSAVIAVIQNQVPELFRQQFEPFKYTVEEWFQTIDKGLSTHTIDIDDLRKRIESAHVQSQQNSFAHGQQSQLDSLVADLAALKRELSALQEDYTPKFNELFGKSADSSAIEKQMDSLMFALRDLEHRYNNITTEEIYQKMVHWFVQSYPTSTALMKDTAQTQEEVNKLKNFCSSISWIQNRSDVLEGLCRNAEKLKTLANSATHLQQLPNNASQVQTLGQRPSPEMQDQIQRAFANAKMAFARAQQIGAELESAKISIASLQDISKHLYSDLSPFAKADGLIALQTKTGNLESQVREMQEERSTGVQELRTILSNQHQRRVEVEQRIKNDINELKSMIRLFEPQVSQVVRQITDVQLAAQERQEEFAYIKKTYIDPNKDFFGMFGTVLTVLAQVQQAVESMNRNLPVAPLNLNWQYYLPELAKPTNSESESESDATYGKDKSNSDA